MIRVAIPSKGRLMDRTLALLAGAGYRVGDRRRDLFQIDPANDVEFVFLRPVDIPVYVAGGELDAGVTGEDLVRERGIDLEPRLRLGFGTSRLCVAVPETSPARTLDDVASLRVATSFPRLAAELLPGPPAIVELAGSVEASVRLGVADAVLDLVETGSTLRAAGLRIVGDRPAALRGLPVRRPPHPFRARVRRAGAHVLPAHRGPPAGRGVRDDRVRRPRRPARRGVRPHARHRVTDRGPPGAGELVLGAVDGAPGRAAHSLMSELAALGAKAIVLTQVENALEIQA